LSGHRRFRRRNFDQKLEKPACRRHVGAFKIRVPIADGVQSIDITGIVVRIQDDGGVALSYATPGHDWPKLLEFLDLKERDD